MLTQLSVYHGINNPWIVSVLGSDRTTVIKFQHWQIQYTAIFDYNDVLIKLDKR